MGHHQGDAAAERQREAAQDLGIVGIGVEQTDRAARGEARRIGCFFAAVAHGDDEAERGEQRREEDADVPGADEERVRFGDQRLDQDVDRSAAAHAERGAEAKGVHLRAALRIREHVAHGGEDDALDRAAADGA